MRNRKWSAIAVVAALLLTVSGVLAAVITDDGGIDAASDVHGHVHHQHGGGEGHLEATSENVRLVGRMNINQDVEGRVSDVGIFKNYAYLGAFNERDCQKGGVYVFDIANPASPKQINFIRTGNNSYVGEGVQVINVTTPAFSGDLLVHNNEICDVTKTGAVGGISLVDVTNPKVHKYLARGFGDLTPVNQTGQSGEPVAHAVHSAFAWDAGDKAYVVMVDNEQAADVDIVDVTDPRKPVIIAEHDLNSMFPNIIDPTLGAAEGFLHDMIVKQINGRWIMLLSYWDSGYVVLDVTDPVNPTYISDSDFAAIDPELLESTGDSRKPEGNGHQAEFSKNNDYIVAADEDFDPYSVAALNVTDGTSFDADQGSATRLLAEGQVIEGQAVYVGRACTADAAVPLAGGPGKIAVVERGVCTFTEKIGNVVGKGYEAAVVFNRQGSDACNSTTGMNVQGDIVTVGVIPRQTGFAFFGAEGVYNDAACLAGSLDETAPIAIGTTGDTIKLESYFDGWGYVHLYRNNGGKLQALDTYAIPEAHDVARASGFGDLSVHEVAMSEVRNELAYFSYYSGGFRVVQIQNDTLVEVGRFIDQGGNNFWGVQVFQMNGKEYVAASDRDYGVYIFEYTGP
ncbi:MAG: hypothetical protein RLZZ387_362 [Chloroflexota bacterium]